MNEIDLFRFKNAADLDVHYIMKQFLSIKLLIFSYPSILTYYVWDAQKNHLRPKKNIELFLRHRHISFKSPALLFFLLLSKDKNE